MLVACKPDKGRGEKKRERNSTRSIISYSRVLCLIVPVFEVSARSTWTVMSCRLSIFVAPLRSNSSPCHRLLNVPVMSRLDTPLIVQRRKKKKCLSVRRTIGARIVVQPFVVVPLLLFSLRYRGSLSTLALLVSRVGLAHNVQVAVVSLATFPSDHLAMLTPLLDSTVHFHPPRLLL